MQFITSLAGVALEIYQLENTNAENRRQTRADNEYRTQEAKNKSKNVALAVGAAVVIGLVYLKAKK